MHSLSSLPEQAIGSQADYELARKHAPFIQFDSAEPFLPGVVGYTVFREAQSTSSFPRQITPPSDGVCIEYAIWWDWDIQHLYELEHIWVYLDGQGKLVNAEASWHGGFHQMVDEQQNIPTKDGRLIIYSEPGKHAFAPLLQWMLDSKPGTDASCGIRCGVMGVLVTPLFKGIIQDRTANNNQLAHTYLERHKFVPTYDFSQIFPLESVPFVMWENLVAWIPERVHWWVDELDRTIPYSERRVLRIAHRGASAYAQENSAEALTAAAHMGADLVEVDLRVTVDHIPVISHDEGLKRVYGIEGTIGGMTFEELAALTGILSFDGLLKICSQLGLGIYLDIKELTSLAAQKLFEIADRYGYAGYIVFSSTRADFVADIKALRPDILTSILFNSLHVDPVKLAQSVKADYVHPCWEKRAEQPHTLLTETWLKQVRDADLGIITWHEERPTEIDALLKMGVNGICSDTPDLLIR